MAVIAPFGCSARHTGNGAPPCPHGHTRRQAPHGVYSPARQHHRSGSPRRPAHASAIPARRIPLSAPYSVAGNVSGKISKCEDRDVPAVAAQAACAPPPHAAPVWSAPAETPSPHRPSPGDIPDKFPLCGAVIRQRPSVAVRQPRQRTVRRRQRGVTPHPRSTRSGHPSTHHGPGQHAVRCGYVFGLQPSLPAVPARGRTGGLLLSGISTPHRASQNDSLRLYDDSPGDSETEVNAPASVVVQYQRPLTVIWRISAAIFSRDRTAPMARASSSGNCCRRGWMNASGPGSANPSHRVVPLLPAAGFTG